VPYDSQVTRSDSSALIPEDASKDIIKGAVNQSAALQLFKHRRMTRAQTRLPVVSALPTAYFVTGDTGLKQTTEVNWTNKYLDAEELAVIVPIPEKVLDDVDYDLWAEIRPMLEEAIAIALDNAIFFGTNKPSSWPTDIKTAAAAAGNAVTAGTSAVDIADDINNVMGAVESDGYVTNGFWARAQMKATLRGLRDSQKQPIFNTPLGGIQTVRATPELYNERIIFSMAGLSGFVAGSGNVHLITGDWSQGIIGIRQDLTFKKLDQAALFDGSGALVYNLPQQDMIAMRVVARFAWQVPNPINRMQQTEASRYPFGTLIQA
jgi:HK97 family phage major capsid protein